MKNFICDGNRMQVILAAPAQAGDVVVIGDMVTVSQDTGIADDVVVVYTEGVFELPKGTGALAQGVKVYWDATGKQVTTTASTNKAVGYVYYPAVVADTVVQVKIG
ncbi:MAG: DUF2190 family protein [Prevotella sp.]|jgi:predicted RecA/RadA family phage recombinase|nr:DUF2190 family protein [Prevotella sp.]